MVQVQVQGSRLRFWGFGVSGLGLGFRVLDLGFWALMLLGLRVEPNA